VKADDDDDDDDDAHDTLVARASGFNPVSSSTYRRLSRTLDRDNVCRSGASSSSCRVILFFEIFNSSNPRAPDVRGEDDRRRATWRENATRRLGRTFVVRRRSTLGANDGVVGG
jgi:hypothetical protein